MPDISAAAKEQLVLHQFLSGLPQEVSKQLRATGVMTTLTDVVERAKLLMTIEYHSEAAAVTTKKSSNSKFYDYSNSSLIYQSKWLHCHFAGWGNLKAVWKCEDVSYVTK